MAEPARSKRPAKAISGAWNASAKWFVAQTNDGPTSTGRGRAASQRACSARSDYGMPFQTLFSSVVRVESNEPHSPQPPVLETGSYGVEYQPPVSPDSGLIDQ